MTGDAAGDWVGKRMPFWTDYEEVQRGFRYAECYEKFDKLTKHKTLVCTSINIKSIRRFSRSRSACHL